jgi:hypothetical protein
MGAPQGNVARVPVMHVAEVRKRKALESILLWPDERNVPPVTSSSNVKVLDSWVLEPERDALGPLKVFAKATRTMPDHDGVGGRIEGWAPEVSEIDRQIDEGRPYVPNDEAIWRVLDCLRPLSREELVRLSSESWRDDLAAVSDGPWLRRFHDALIDVPDESREAIGRGFRSLVDRLRRQSGSSLSDTQALALVLCGGAAYNQVTRAGLEVSMSPAQVDGAAQVLDLDPVIARGFAAAFSDEEATPVAYELLPTGPVHASTRGQAFWGDGKQVFIAKVRCKMRGEVDWEDQIWLVREVTPWRAHRQMHEFVLDLEDVSDFRWIDLIETHQVQVPPFGLRLDEW